MLLSLASSLNSVPLPPVSNRFGIRLPPPEHCLTNVNFALVPDAPPASQFGDSMVQQSAPAPKDHRAASAEVMEDTSMDDAHVAGAKRTLDEDEDYD